MRMCSVYLLYVLCLSGRAVRLGQYAQDAAGGTQHGLREYRLLRSKLLARYPDLEPHVRFCDRVYTALRGADPLQLARILRGNDAEYRMDGWQRMLVLHAVPAVRAAAWQVATKAYMYLPVSSHLAGMISPDAVAQPSPQTAHESHLASLLLLQTDILPPLHHRPATHQTTGTRTGNLCPQKRMPRSPLPHIAHPHACITSNVDSVGRAVKLR